MPLNPDRLCACHQAPMMWDGDCHMCHIKYRARQQRYQQSAKGRARQRRYAHSEKGKARNRCYDHSEKGRLAQHRHAKRSNPRRIRIGSERFGYAPTAALAQQITTHLKRRLSESLT